ncbi:single-stranded-DNA-specific exonuclease RecJ [Maricaulis sp.]|uniref:single-stranded-DNA-specific exonuclease RecJ n=1 Tax=Maricaulis sp. TaxID=1486257 RepID=UPI002639D60D|nr:single-stranded-DNA-specific exonuclease RecJ [Maricaulis sp.]
MDDTLEMDQSQDAPLLGVSASLLGKSWRLRTGSEDDVSRIVREQRIEDVLARLIVARGIGPDDAARFLTPRLKDYFPDPSSFADMDKAASLLWDALEAKRSIAVFADYDVDGATSAAQLIRWMRTQGAAPRHYVPDRIEEGYGPNIAAFERLHQDGVELVITVDCGAAAHSALEAAAGIGLEVIVVDHHLMDGAFPPSAALVNPNRPDDQSDCGHMAAAGVTYILLAALNREGRRRGHIDQSNAPDLLAFADLAALGTVCDVVPLTGINRAIVAQGLKVMSRWDQTGLAALAEIAGISEPASVYHAGFLLGPRINAGGRVGQADLGVQLLTTDSSEDATRHARRLDLSNTERRAIEAEVLDAAIAQVERQGADRAVLVAAGEGWHPGVIGVVAGRIKERFDKPSIVIGIDRDAQPAVGKGSGRSVPGVNLGGAIAAAREAGLLLSGGGHAMAGGLTVNPDAINALIEFLDARLAPELAAAEDARTRWIDGILSPAAATLDLCRSIETLGPFGQGNPEPRFVMPDVRVTYAKRVGSDHVRASLEGSDGARVAAIGFRLADLPAGEALLRASDQRLHIAGRLKINAWQGRESVQLQIEDIAPAN